MGVPFWGVPMVRTAVFGGSILGPIFMETTIHPQDYEDRQGR